MAAGFPLLRPGKHGDLTNRVIHFMMAERNLAYELRLEGNDIWPEGQFFAGMKMAKWP